LADEPPSAPSNLTASGIPTSRTSLVQDASIDNPDAAGYRVYRGEAEIGFSPAPSYADRNIEPGIAYTYVASACDKAGNRSALSTPMTVTATMPPEGIKRMLNGQFAAPVYTARGKRQPNHRTRHPAMAWNRTTRDASTESMFFNNLRTISPSACELTCEASRIVIRR
jgi:hypothetical protein